MWTITLDYEEFLENVRGHHRRHRHHHYQLKAISPK